MTILTAWLRRSREGKMLAQPPIGEGTGRTGGASTFEVCIPPEAVLECRGVVAALRQFQFSYIKVLT